MKPVIVCGLILAFAGVGSAFDIGKAIRNIIGGIASNFGNVKSSMELQFHNKHSGRNVSASVKVNHEVTKDDVKEFLAKFNSTLDTKILIHGWLSNYKKQYVTDLIDAYLMVKDHNIIFVNWDSESFQLYLRAAQAVPKLGPIIASLIDVLVQDYEASLDKIHIVGHSLGAHIAGIAGLRIKSSEKIGRISGLDPAFPSFSLEMTDRLRAESAKFVDVIHTCSNVLSFKEPLGHVDFYPNGGNAVQPGCGLVDLIAGTCSHSRSTLFFVESVASPRAFLATKCNSYSDYEASKCDDNDKVYMGESVTSSARGTYYLKTNSSSPYGLGDEVKSNPAFS